MLWYKLKLRSFYMDEDKIYIYKRGESEPVLEAPPGERFLKYLYSSSKKRVKTLRALIGKLPLVSHLLGFFYKLSFTKKSVKKFIEKYKIDASEFKKRDFKSFNDFFVRELKKEARPIANDAVVMPADSRLLVIDNLENQDCFYVKGKGLSLKELLGGNTSLAEKYRKGSMVLARLAPPDYHRFHSPVEGRIKQILSLGGYLFSVSPIALRRNIDYLTENKRVVITIETNALGDILFIPVGATSVGSICHNCSLDKEVKRGEELGFFALGGSMVLLLFEPGKVSFAKDLLDNSKKGFETLCKMGSPLAEKVCKTTE